MMGIVKFMPSNSKFLAAVSTPEKCDAFPKDDLLINDHVTLETICFQKNRIHREPSYFENGTKMITTFPYTHYTLWAVWMLCHYGLVSPHSDGYVVRLLGIKQIAFHTN